MPSLQYRTFIESLLENLPETRMPYESLQDKLGSGALPHLVVPLVLEPLAKQALNSSNLALLKRIFTFFEEMACAQDLEVRNLLYVGIFEAWVSEAETLSRAWKYMGECTREMSVGVADQLHCGHNLPKPARERLSLLRKTRGLK